MCITWEITTICYKYLGGLWNFLNAEMGGKFNESLPLNGESHLLDKCGTGYIIEIVVERALKTTVSLFSGICCNYLWAFVTFMRRFRSVENGKLGLLLIYPSFMDPKEEELGEKETQRRKNKWTKKENMLLIKSDYSRVVQLSF